MHSVGFCTGGIGLSKGNGVVVFEESGKTGKIVLLLLAARSSVLAGKVSLVTLRRIWGGIKKGLCISFFKGSGRDNGNIYRVGATNLPKVFLYRSLCELEAR